MIRTISFVIIALVAHRIAVSAAIPEPVKIDSGIVSGSIPR
jgi:hypothetical protein